MGDKRVRWVAAVGLMAAALAVGCGEAGVDEEPAETVRQARAAISQNLFSETEPNDGPTGANGGPANILPGGNVVVAGTLHVASDDDWFAFTGNAGDRVYAASQTTMYSTSASTTVDIIDTDGTTILETDSSNGTFGNNSGSVAGTLLPSSGTYFIRVTSSHQTAYHLHFNVESGVPIAEVELNDFVPQALPPGGGWVAGTMSGLSDVDTFAIVAAAGDTIFASLDLDPERDNVSDWAGKLTVSPFNGKTLVVDDPGSSGPDSEAVALTVDAAGTYVIGVATASGPSIGTYNLSVSTQPATPKGVNCATYTSTDIPKTIAVNTTSTVTSTVTIPGNPILADIDVGIDINHTNMPDLSVHLISPAGNDNGLFSSVGSATDQHMKLVIDDEAALSIADFVVVGGLRAQPGTNGGLFNGTNPYRMSWYEGENGGGVWTLVVRDIVGGNGGTLNGWSITICEQPSSPCPGGAAPIVLSAADFEGGVAGFTHSGVLDEWELGTPSYGVISSCSSGTQCWKTDLDSTYQKNSIQDLVSPTYDLTGVVGPLFVEWSMKYQMGATPDKLVIDAAQVGGTQNQTLFRWLGPTMTDPVGVVLPTITASAGWGRHRADISSFAGLQTQLGFHVTTGTGNVQQGVAIDDVKLLQCPPPSCGNGAVEAVELCDDGNLVDGDGCDNNCTFSACGNGIVANGEVCDDGNLVNGDGCDSNCQATGCGNGVTTAGEVCDDGNLADGDGCDSNCTPSACGNGVVSPGETCDDGNLTSGDGCDANCLPTGCGNGIVTAGEVCDDGNPVSGDGCDANCKPTGCGNGVVTAGELCDDNNLANGDGCDSNCTPTACGNGILTGGEACDDGNSFSGDGCDVNCMPTECGNGILTVGEVCDDGNITNGDGCDANCTPTGCGNGLTTAGEACDDGNLVNGDGCDANCKLTGCGNGVVTLGEACDDGNLVNGDGCDANCKLTGCGNGVVTLGEACDDGNLVSGDGCDVNCTVTGCGNGVKTFGEGCDDGNAQNGDGCDVNCTVSVCGNGVVGGAETCDDGNGVSGDGCDANCTPSACGNGIAAGGEACDDGNLLDDDGCDSNCTPSGCGNGIVNSGESCDDGNTDDSDGCQSNCTFGSCGDGITSGGEACDDGNMTEGDGCDSNCTPTACGNGIVSGLEACDDGNTVSGDGCDQNCMLEGMGAGGGGPGAGGGGDGGAGGSSASSTGAGGMGAGGTGAGGSGSGGAASGGGGPAGSGSSSSSGGAAGAASSGSGAANLATPQSGCTYARPQKRGRSEGLLWLLPLCLVAFARRRGVGSGLIVRFKMAVCGRNGEAQRTMAIQGFLLAILCFGLVAGCNADGGPRASSAASGAGGAGSTSASTGGGGGNAACGDGAVDDTEECDDAGESALCNDDCSIASCGDGKVNATAGEECDDSGASALCNADCSSSFCGDGLVNAAAGEDCDDAGESATCNSDCSAAACGDGQLNVTSGEACDDGGESASCNGDCSESACGDGKVNATSGEDCDDATETALCNADCSLAGCGDGKVNAAAGEACDDAGESATCDGDCSLTQCGDGYLNTEAGEACDDMGESLLCDDDCTPSACGDGKINASAGETCDDVGESAQCNADCSVASCGDGTTNAAAGEACDDAGESITCDSDCTLASCGDGTINLTLGEACDDGGESIACNADCTPTLCGDTKLNAVAGETCDDGNANDGDGCSKQCAGECAGASLTTSYAFGFGAQGNMFDVIAAYGVTISSLDVHLSAGTYDVEIYAKNGTFVGSEVNSAAWSLVAHYANISGNGQGTPTPLPGNLNLNVSGTLGLYVTITSGQGFNYVSGTQVGAIAATDGVLSVTQGTASAYPFGAPFSPRTWTGTIHYSRNVTAPLSGGSGYMGGGNMFNVKALNQVTIDGLWMNLDNGPHNVEVYYAPGGYAGIESTPAAWTLAGSASGVVDGGPGKATFVPLNPAITLPRGATYGFYATTVSTHVNDTVGSAEGAILVQDPNLIVYQGKGVGYPFGAGFGFASPRSWNGILEYSVCGSPTYSVDYGVIARGGSLKVTGTNFANASAVTIGGVPQPFVVNSNNQLTISAVDGQTPLGTQSLEVVPEDAGPSGAFVVTVIDLRVNELDSDQAGTDTMEYVELSTGVPFVDLSGYSLVFWNGADTKAYQVVALNALADINGLLVVGSSTISPQPALTWNGTSVLQNGADAVGIYQKASSAFVVGVTSVNALGLIDALVYDTDDADDPGLLSGLFGPGYLNLVGAVQVNENLNGASATESIQRCGAGLLDGTKFGLGAPSPGQPNSIAPCP